MKNKVLIGGLVVFLLAGVIGCPTDNSNSKSSPGYGGDDNDNVEKVIAERWRGTYILYKDWKTPDTDSKLEIRMTEKEYIIGEYEDDVFTETGRCEAYTEGLQLYEIVEKGKQPVFGIELGPSEFRIGRFNTDDGSFTRVNEMETWRKK